MAKSSFKQEHDLEKRRAEAARIREKYADRIPTQNAPCLSTLQIYSAAGLEEVEARARRDGGKSFHIASGGLCGEREIADVLKISPIPFIELNGIVLYLYFFGVNKQT